MSTSLLSSWPIFSLLEPEFASCIHMVFVFGDSGNEALIVTKDDMVYGLGSNNCGCLGIGNEIPTLYPVKVKALCKKYVRTFAYGSIDIDSGCHGNHVLALTNNGKVYSWGNNSYGQLGYEALDNVLMPTLVEIPIWASCRVTTCIIDIACGSCHSVALTDAGEVFVWGRHNCRQVRFWEDFDNVPRFVNCLGTNKVASFSCGDTFTMIVTTNCRVYCFGDNDVGQLGIGNRNARFKMEKVTSLKNTVIVKVACGYAHTLALTDEGELYVWGSNSHGQLGIGNKTDTPTPVMVKHEMGRVLDIAALHYNNISIAVGEAERIYIWGQCRDQSITSPIITPFSSIYEAFAYHSLSRVMHKPLILRENKQCDILECLRIAFDDPSTSDLKIQMKDQCIHVHKAILKIRSEYFKSMFAHDWTESNESVIKHNQFSYVVYKAFLNYLYTDTINLSWKQVIELWKLADSYCDFNLKKRCMQMIKQGITVSNVAYLYNIAIEFNEKELENVCFKFALNHMTAVTQTEDFVELKYEIVKAFIIKAAKKGAFRT